MRSDKVCAEPEEYPGQVDDPFLTVDLEGAGSEKVAELVVELAVTASWLSALDRTHGDPGWRLPGLPANLPLCQQSAQGEFAPWLIWVFHAVNEHGILLS